MKLLIIFSAICLALSLLANVKKTWSGIRKGLMMFLKLLPVLLSTLALVSIVLWLITEEALTRYMGNDSGTIGWIAAALIGSVALIPGFIAYPLCGILVDSGVALSVIAVFITTLMMTGFLTLPIEARFFGWKVSIIRNVVSLAGALVVGLIMGMIL